MRQTIFLGGYMIDEVGLFNCPSLPHERQEYSRHAGRGKKAWL